MNVMLTMLLGMDLIKGTMKDVYDKFGLEPNTRDFIGHSMALYPTDEYTSLPGNAEEVVMRIKSLDDYQRFFALAFAGDTSAVTIGKALGSYQRGLVTGPNKFDRWRFGHDQNAMSPREIA